MQLFVLNQVLQLVACYLIVGKFQPNQIWIGGKILQTCELRFVKSKLLKTSELLEVGLVIRGERSDGHLVENKVLKLKLYERLPLRGSYPRNLAL